MGAHNPLPGLNAVDPEWVEREAAKRAVYEEGRRLYRIHNPGRDLKAEADKES